MPLKQAPLALKYLSTKFKLLLVVYKGFFVITFVVFKYVFINRSILLHFKEQCKGDLRCSGLLRGVLW